MIRCSTRSNRKNLPLRAAGFLSVQLLLIAWTTSASCCFYTRHHFDPDDSRQSNVSGLLYNRYVEENKRPRGFFADELKAFKPDPAKPDNRDEHAFLLYKNGRFPEAENIWKSLLAEEPGRHTTLCNYATALHFTGRYAEALPLLRNAVKARPGFRRGAEELHIRMIEFQMQNRAQPGYSTTHMFIPELAAVWEARSGPPETFEKVKPPKVDPDSLAELLRQFPSFGEAWFCLGVLLEAKEDFADAKFCYERAIKGTVGRRSEVSRHIEQLELYLKKHDPVKSTARMLTYSIIGIVILAILFWVLRTGRSVYLDMQEAKKSQQKTTKGKPGR